MATPVNKKSQASAPRRREWLFSLIFHALLIAGIYLGFGKTGELPRGRGLSVLSLGKGGGKTGAPEIFSAEAPSPAMRKEFPDKETPAEKLVQNNSVDQNSETASDEETSGKTGNGEETASVGDGAGGGGAATGVPGLMGMGDGLPGALLLGGEEDHRPPYPRWARERSLQGKITLELEVLPTGRVGTVRLLESTGNDSLDQHTIRWAKEKLLFEPARLDGQPVTTFYKLSWKYELGG